MVFTGKWIGASDELLKHLTNAPAQDPALVGKWLFVDDYVRVMYRKDFDIEEIASLSCADLHIEYEFPCDIRINGVHVEKDSDITPLCRNGRNTIGIRCYMTDTPERFLMALRGRVRLSFGAKTQWIVTDETWKAGYVYWGQKESEHWHSEDIPRLSRLTAFDLHPALVKRSLYLRRDFRLKGEAVQAKVRASAKGFYTLYINGKPADDSLMNPGVTPVAFSTHSDIEHNKTLYSQDYDITGLLNPRDNTIGVLTANGWYGSECHSTVRALRHEFLADIEITYRDGTTQTIGTDEQWRVMLSPLVQDDLQLGERYDARLEIEGWNEPGPEISAWGFASVFGEDTSHVKVQSFEKIRITAVLDAIWIQRRPDGSVLYDFGLNGSGRALLSLKNTKPGQRIIVEYFEQLSAGTEPVYNPYENVFYRDDTQLDGISRWANKNADCYFCKGGESETHAFLNAYTGFRYALLSGYDNADEKTVRYNVFHTDLKKATSFSCACPLLEKIWTISSRSFITNYHYGPTDCPTREKNFWNGDLEMFLPAALWMFDASRALKAWTTEGRKLYARNTAWIDEDYLTPWYLYLFTADEEVLKDNYPKIRQLIEGRIQKIDRSEYGDFTFGDHLPPHGLPGMNPEYFNMLYYFLSMNIGAKIAEVLGEGRHAASCAAYADALKKEINARYYKEEEAYYCDTHYSSQVLALAFGVAEESRAAKVCATLDGWVRRDGYRWNVGGVGAAYLLNVLSDHGYDQTAYRLASQSEYPSQGYMVMTGGTTLYEGWEYTRGKTAWEGVNQKGSYNHYFKGACCRWYVEYLGGLAVPDIDNVAFERIRIRPRFIRDLDDVNVCYQSVKGDIVSKWHRKDGAVTLTVKIPQGVSAKITVPDDKAAGGVKVLETGAGEHTFVCRA